MSKTYEEFLLDKTQFGDDSGFAPVFMPDFLFDFQTMLVDWAIRKGRAAIFADCGLGKTLMQLVWAWNVAKKTGKRVLILTPLAVSAQTVREAERFGIECARSGDGNLDGLGPVVVTNYERLHHFSARDFIGCVCDESSILKNFSGVRRNEITEFMRHLPYRLLCTATAAPNDFIELGTSSEALGYLGHMDMMNRFFKNDLNNSASGRMHGKVIEWRFKGHAEEPFWRYTCSWARPLRKPSDIGCEDRDFTLPELFETEHVIDTKTLREGMLFPLPAVGMREQREERRLTIPERVDAVSNLVDKRDCSLIWCHLNPEGDLLEKTIPDCVQVSGRDSDEEKEEKFLAFISGQIRRLALKPKIGAWGLNFQHCAHQVTFPSNSFEQYYQQTRRSWRFGQKRPVTIDIVMTEGDKAVMANQRRKAQQADEMFERLVASMNNVLRIERGVKFTTAMENPAWL